MANTLHDISGEHVACIPFREHAAATASETMCAWVAPFDCAVTALEVLFDANITGADTNYTTFGVSTTSDGSDVQFLEIDYKSGTNATAGTAVASTETPFTLDAGKVLNVWWEKVASGLKIPTGLLVIKYQGA